MEILRYQTSASGSPESPVVANGVVWGLWTQYSTRGFASLHNRAEKEGGVQGNAYNMFCILSRELSNGGNCERTMYHTPQMSERLAASCVDYKLVRIYMSPYKIR
jgi:hypothetical protein